MTGPLSGSRVAGPGTFCAVSKGPLANMAASTQANGLFGAFLCFSGFDETGKPLPKTLRFLGLDYLIQDLKAVL